MCYNGPTSSTLSFWRKWIEQWDGERVSNTHPAFHLLPHISQPSLQLDWPMWSILWNPSSDHHCPFRLVDACNIPVIIILNVIPVHDHLTLDIQAKSCIMSPLKVPFTSVSIIFFYLVGGFVSLNLQQVLNSNQRSYFVKKQGFASSFAVLSISISMPKEESAFWS